MKPSSRRIKSFQKKILGHFRKHMRSFPWRETRNPYRILVSEIMLQQTQADRVVPYYRAFLKKFPTIKVLARSSLADILKIWQGLGYNRRAKHLRQASRVITGSFRGRFSQTLIELKHLPGVGPYTAGAVLVFAFNEPVVLIETNIRRVFINEFFKNNDNISDPQIEPLIELTLDHRNPRRWYQALMDYGSLLAKQLENPNRRSKHYTRQSKFKNSDRQVRGEIVRSLLKTPSLTIKQLKRGVKVGKAGRLEKIIKNMINEGMLVKSGRVFSLEK